MNEGRVEKRPNASSGVVTYNLTDGKVRHVVASIDEDGDGAVIKVEYGRTYRPVVTATLPESAD